MENQYFTNRDLNLCATLTTLGFSIDHVDKSDPRKVVFYFVRTLELERSVELYWNDSLNCNPKTLLSNVKALKGRIYSED